MPQSLVGRAKLVIRCACSCAEKYALRRQGPGCIWMSRLNNNPEREQPAQAAPLKYVVNEIWALSAVPGTGEHCWLHLLRLASSVRGNTIAATSGCVRWSAPPLPSSLLPKEEDCMVRSLSEARTLANTHMQSRPAAYSNIQHGRAHTTTIPAARPSSKIHVTNCTTGKWPSPC